MVWQSFCLDGGSSRLSYPLRAPQIKKSWPQYTIQIDWPGFRESWLNLRKDYEFHPSLWFQQEFFD